MNGRLDAIKSGKVDPINEWDPNAYDSMAVRIRRSPHSVKFSDIHNMVGKGMNGGITADQADVLLGVLKKYQGADILGNDLHRNYSSAISSMKTAKAFSKNKVENAKLAAKAMSTLDAWAIKQESPNAQDYQDFMERLTDTSDLSWWTRLWAGRDAAEGRVAVGRNLAEIQREVTESKKWNKGDKRTVGGTTYTFDGEVWRD